MLSFTKEFMILKARYNKCQNVISLIWYIKMSECDICYTYLNLEIFKSGILSNFSLDDLGAILPLKAVPDTYF